MTAGSTNAFLSWFAEWGQVIYFAAQILFWAAIAASAVIVALQYKRLVGFKVDGAAPAAEPEVTSTDVFVE